MKSALSHLPSCRLSASSRVKSICIFNGNAGSYLVGASFSSVQFSCSVQIFTVAEMSKFHSEICNTESKRIPSLADSYIKPPRKSNMGLPSSSGSKHPPAKQETQDWFLGWEDPLDKEMATHSCIHAWRIPWMDEPGGLQSMGLQRVGHAWATNTYTKSNIYLDSKYMQIDGVIYFDPEFFQFFL